MFRIQANPPLLTWSKANPDVDRKITSTLGSTHVGNFIVVQVRLLDGHFFEYPAPKPEECATIRTASTTIVNDIVPPSRR